MVMGGVRQGLNGDYVITQLSAWVNIGKAALLRSKIPADVMGPGVQSIIFCGYGKSGSDYRIKHLCFFMKNSDESNGRICSLQSSLFTSILS